MVEIVESEEKNSWGENVFTLAIDGVIWMDNGDWELEDAINAAKNAKGKCFVAGLGMGLILQVLWNNPDVESVDVVEINKEVLIETKKYLLLHKKLTHEQFDKTNFVLANAFSVDKKLLRNKKFDYVYCDTYLEPDVTAYVEIQQVLNNLKKQDLLQNNTVVSGWMYDRIKKEIENVQNTTDV